MSESDAKRRKAILRELRWQIDHLRTEELARPRQYRLGIATRRRNVQNEYRELGGKL